MIPAVGYKYKTKNGKIAEIAEVILKVRCEGEIYEIDPLNLTVRGGDGEYDLVERVEWRQK